MYLLDSQSIITVSIPAKQILEVLSSIMACWIVCCSEMVGLTHKFVGSIFMNKSQNLRMPTGIGGAEMIHAPQHISNVLNKYFKTSNSPLAQAYRQRHAIIGGDRHE